MKSAGLVLLILALPLCVEGSVSESLKQLSELRSQNALCEMSEDEHQQIINSLEKARKRGNHRNEVVDQTLADLSAARAKCTESALQQQRQLTAALLYQLPGFPAGIMGPWTNIEHERELNLQSLAFVQSMEGKPCTQLSADELYQDQSWHELFLSTGWGCTVDNYQHLSARLNQQQGYGKSQAQFGELATLNLNQLKSLFRQTFQGKGLKLAFVPQLSWENGALNSTFPYSLLTKPTELTTYTFLRREFRRLGIPSVIVSRNSLNSLEQQVSETAEGLGRLRSSHVVVSRSMGSRIIRELVAQQHPVLTSKVSAWLNVGGTPHGSVIALEKTQPDSFYRGVVPSLVGAFKLPVGLVARDPRIPSHLEDTLYAALIRSNLATLSPVQPKQLESTLPVMNAVFLRRDHERAAPLVDPVWTHMLHHGPTEGSALLTGAAVDTANSMRLMVDGDHLSFWKLKPQEALALYLRFLITAERSGLLN